jgi:hypothetical protein
MTKKQLKLYGCLCEHVKEKIGFSEDGRVGGLDVGFEAGKGTWYVQGHGYLDDLVRWGEVPDCILPRPRRSHGG